MQGVLIEVEGRQHTAREKQKVEQFTIKPS